MKDCGAITRSRCGQSAVFLAWVLTLLVAFLTVSIDAGRVFVVKEQLQAAADAAALAGAACLPGDETGAESAAIGLAGVNGVTSTHVTATVEGASTNQLAVTDQAVVPLFFGPIIGIPTASVSATAVAEAGSAGVMTGLIPLGVYEGNYVPGETYTLKEDTGSGGAFGALWFGDATEGADTYRNDLEYGSPALVTLGSTVILLTGDMVGPTDQGLASRLTAPATPVGDPSSPRYVFVPITTTPSNGTVTVVGFAAFWLQSASGGEVTGEFLNRVVSTTMFSSALSKTGLVQVALVR